MKTITLKFILIILITLTSCINPYETDVVTCDERIAFWEGALKAELNSGELVNQNRVEKLEIIIQEIKDECK